MSSSIPLNTNPIFEACTKKKTQLCIATKTQSIENIRAANIDSSIILAENRVQEAETKQEYFQSVENKIHLIGPLQKNKVRKAIHIFDVIQSVDSLSLLEKINTIAMQEGKNQAVFLSVNISEDEKKTGFSKDDFKDFREKFSAQKFPNICIQGLFTILKNNLTDTQKHAYYKQMYHLKKASQTKIPTLRYLSMGMSSDWKIALEEGATIVRIGSTIFGKRSN